MTRYVAFNQDGRAMAESVSIGELINAMNVGRFQFYFIANERNYVILNEMKGRPLPNRTSRGTIASPPEPKALHESFE